MLSALREVSRQSQQEVADKLGVSRSTYAKWEISAREPDHCMLVKIADLFAVTTDYLLARPHAVVSYSVEALLEVYDRLTRPKMEDA